MIGSSNALTGLSLLGLVTGAVVVIGGLLVVLGALPASRTPASPAAGRPRGLRLRQLRGVGRGARSAAVWRSLRLRTAVGLLVGAAAWAASGWAVALLVVPAAVVGLPVLLAKSDTDAGVRRLEALEEWTRHLAGVLDVGVGLEQAIVVNLRSTPAAVRPEVQTLVARLSARWPTETALRAFADDLDDATGDLVAASLVLGARRRGAGLTRVLQGLAETVAEEVKMRRAVEADRAKPRTTARAVTLITLSVLALLSFNTTYIAPYGSGPGQLVLLLLLGAYAAALAWMRVITRGRATPRFLPAAEAPPARAEA